MNQSRNNNLVWWILGGIVVLLCCCLLFLVGTGGLLFGLRTSTTESGQTVITVEVQPLPAQPTATDQPPTSGLATATPSSQAPVQPGTSLPNPAVSDFLTEEVLRDTIVPARDLRTLAEGLRAVGPIPEVVHASAPVYRLNQVETFWVSNEDTQEHQQIDARLVYMNDVVYVWVEDGVSYSLDNLRRAADKFASETYPTNRSFFGSEWNPGIDNDPRLHILHSEQLGERIAGYFSGADSVSGLAQPYSNQREMFYINIGNTKPNTEAYNGTLAHEFQHMIHWFQDRNETNWVNEGLSELAMQLNGYDTGGADWVFSRVPDTQLNAWSDDPDGRTQHYGAAYLFMAYVLQRFGNEVMQAVVAEDANDIEGFDAVLARSGLELTFDDVFADWVAANLLDDPSLDEGQFGYKDYNPQSMALDTTHRRFPVQRESEVSQYAVDYVELKGSGDLAIDFRGASSARLAATAPFSGSYAWWGNRVDDSDARLTRAFDLSGVDSATLSFHTWYDIEDDWDYAYVMASTDGGETWTPLQTQDTVDTNPHGNSFGWAFTGCSGDPTSTEPGDPCNARWIEQKADLTPFAGNPEVLLRFEYITDDAVIYPGFFLDDVSIPEIGFFDDMERDDGGWVSEGWLRTDNILRQRWLLQLIELQDGQDPVITRIPVDETGVAQGTVSDLGRRKSAILAISALAPVTTEKALYEYSITQQ